MDLAWWSLLALAAVVVASCTLRVNPGLLAIVFAWLIVVYAAPRFGETLGMAALARAFPAELFLTLLGVCLLFAAADANGTLAQVAGWIERLCRGNVGLIVLAFFWFPLVLGTIGPGNIASAALVAPIAMATGRRLGIAPLLVAIVVGHGAIGSTLSPLSAAGVVADRILADMGLGGHEWQVYLANALVNAAAAALGFTLFGGWQLLGRWHREPIAGDSEIARPVGLAREHRITLAVIACVLLAVVAFGAQVGMAAFAGALILILLGAADQRQAMQKLPWSVILMVSLVSTLAAILDLTGGTRRFAEIVDAVSNPQTVNPVLAFFTGIVSIYSSTTGVVLPAFLPMVKNLAEVQPEANPMGLALSVILGGNLVDVSPLSTIGALCVAAAPVESDRRRLFNQLLAWGFALSLFAALACWLVGKMLG